MLTKIYVSLYLLAIKLRIMRLDYRLEDQGMIDGELLVSLVCEPKWFFQKKSIESVS